MIRITSIFCAVCDVTFKETYVGVSSSLQHLPYRTRTCYLLLDRSYCLVSVLAHELTILIWQAFSDKESQSR